MPTKIRGIQIVDDPVIGGVQGLGLPVGTTSNRPASPSAGLFRGNSTTGFFEGFLGGLWQPLISRVGAGAATPLLQVRRSTTYALTTAAAVVTLDTTDVVSDATLLYRDTTNTNRIYAAQAGYYQFTYSATMLETNNGTTDTVYLSKNGTATVPGSTCAVSPRSATADMSRTVFCLLAAGDFVTIMALKSASAGTGIIQTDLTLCVRKV